MPALSKWLPGLYAREASGSDCCHCVTLVRGWDHEVGCPGCTCSAGLLYDWLYPAHFPALRCSLQAWADDPEVANIILKFLAEFVWNKTSRLSFDSCSANGILLFREVSQVVQPLLSLNNASPHPLRS